MLREKVTGRKARFLPYYWIKTLEMLTGFTAITPLLCLWEKSIRCEVKKMVSVNEGI